MSWPELRVSVSETPEHGCGITVMVGLRFLGVTVTQYPVSELEARSERQFVPRLLKPLSIPWVCRILPTNDMNPPCQGLVVIIVKYFN
jgi:hypothetical protein